MDDNHLDEPPMDEPDERLSRDGERPPDLILCLERSHKEHRQRLVDARKTMPLVGAMLAVALVAATFFWLARNDSAFWAGKHTNAWVDANSIPELTLAKPAPPKVEARAQLPSAKPTTVNADPKTTGAPDSVIQLGAFRSQAQAERAWTDLSARFTAVGKMDKLILPFRGGIRLRAGARSRAEATQACDEVTAAGENCFIPR
jgi:hypothetical protein